MRSLQEHKFKEEYSKWCFHKGKLLGGICPVNSTGQKKFLLLKQRQVNSVPTMTGYSEDFRFISLLSCIGDTVHFLYNSYFFSKELPKNCLYNNFVYKSWDTLHHQHARTLIFWRCQLYHVFLIMKYFRHQKWHVHIHHSV